jgi:FAD/FMN-containing dehydrogenase
MGAQQFGSGAILVDTQGLNKVLHFDTGRGFIEVEAGIQWPQLIDYLISTQQELPLSRQWGIAQKQTGADRLSIGGSLAANIHGRGLQMRPIVADIESLVLVDAQGVCHTCSRQENVELFRLSIGGYGLFGFIYSVKLRLIPRQKVERVVELITINQLMPAFERRMIDGFLYGDFQFSTNEQSSDFLQRGVFACYRPVDPDVPLANTVEELSVEAWSQLFYLAHVDKAEAFRQYSRYYLATNGQIYGSDTHQLSTYIDDYHQGLDQELAVAHPATEVITEVYVPRVSLPEFMAKTRADFRRYDVNLIYGTIRLIETDPESFLAWAKQPYACIIFNLHTVHTPEGIANATDAFRRLIDSAIELDGSYYLTYHKYATRRQVETCYPQMPEFLRLKQAYDPEERFQSDWYHHYKEMFADILGSDQVSASG